MLNGFLGKCREGVGGIEVESGGMVGIGGLVGVGGCSSGGASGTSGGKGVECKRKHGGKVWRFEAEDGNGGIGVDSSVEKVGMKDIAGNGFGGVVESEERIMSGSCGMNGRRVVAVEDCRTIEAFSFCDKSRVLLFLSTIVDKRRMSKSLTTNPVLTLQSSSFV